jgi:hypothetical protein
LKNIYGFAEIDERKILSSFSELQCNGSKSLFSEPETIKLEARNWNNNQAQVDRLTRSMSSIEFIIVGKY